MGLAETLAELIIAEELKRGGELTISRTDPFFQRLRAETTMTVGWIAERLAMGTRGYLNHLLYRRRSWAGSNQYQELTPFLTPFAPFSWVSKVLRQQARYPPHEK